MPSAAPLTVCTTASLSLLVACLTLAGCGNRGELYLPADAGGEPEELVTGRPEGTPPQAPLPDAQSRRRVVTPSDSVNSITPPTSTSGGATEGDGAGEDDGGNRRENERDGEDAGDASDDVDGVER